jgi:hypothetical protein
VNFSVNGGNGNYVPFVTSSGPYGYGTTPLNGFSNNLTSAVYGQPTPGNTITFAPSPGIPYSSSVEVYTYGSSYDQVSVNGGTNVSTPNLQWTTVKTGSGTITSMVFSDFSGLISNVET